jgi:hypothetical protein
VNNLKYIFAFIIFFIFVIIYNDQILIFGKEIFNRLLIYQEQNFTIFLFLLLIVNFIYFLSPIPTFPIIIFNGFILKNMGFILSYIIIIVCSLILFKSIKRFKFILNNNFFLKILEKINNNKNNDVNFFVIASSRYVLPYFVHNIFFGSILKNIKIFFIAILIGEIPIIFILNQFGSQLRDLSDLTSINLSDILKIEYLLTLICFFLFLTIINRSTKYIKKKLK